LVKEIMRSSGGDIFLKAGKEKVQSLLFIFP
jgi:hypothetical protein